MLIIMSIGYKSKYLRKKGWQCWIKRTVRENHDIQIINSTPTCWVMIKISYMQKAMYADSKDIPCVRNWGRDIFSMALTEKLPWTFKVLKQVRSIRPTSITVFVVHSDLSTWNLPHLSMSYPVYAMTYTILHERDKTVISCNTDTGVGR